MNWLSLFCFVFAFGVAYNLQCGEFSSGNILQTRIVNGEVAAIGEFPWQVSIQRKVRSKVAQAAILPMPINGVVSSSNSNSTGSSNITSTTPSTPIVSDNHNTAVEMEDELLSEEELLRNSLWGRFLWSQLAEMQNITFEQIPANWPPPFPPMPTHPPNHTIPPIPTHPPNHKAPGHPPNHKAPGYPPNTAEHSTFPPWSSTQWTSAPWSSTTWSSGSCTSKQYPPVPTLPPQTNPLPLPPGPSQPQPPQQQPYPPYPQPPQQQPYPPYPQPPQQQPQPPRPLPPLPPLPQPPQQQPQPPRPSPPLPPYPQPPQQQPQPPRPLPPLPPYPQPPQQKPQPPRPYPPYPQPPQQQPQPPRPLPPLPPMPQPPQQPQPPRPIPPYPQPPQPPQQQPQPPRPIPPYPQPPQQPPRPRPPPTAGDQRQKWQHFCGGSIIDNSWILTAAHCVESMKSTYTSGMIQIVAGSIDWRNIDQTSGQVISVDRIVVHTGWSQQSGQNDIALLHLQTPLRFVKQDKVIVNKVCLSRVMNQEHSGMATSSGWGFLNKDRRVTPDLLRRVDLPVVGHDVCRNAFNRVIGISQMQVCAGQSPRGNCMGDSGGPLVQKQGNQATQIGIVSFSIPCAVPGYPDVFTRVSKYLDWIITNTGLTLKPT